MQEKEPRQSFLTWEAAAVVLASVGVGAFLGSEKARLAIRRELRRCYRGFRNEIRKGQDRREAAEFGRKARKVLVKAFPEGLKAEK